MHRNLNRKQLLSTKLISYPMQNFLLASPVNTANNKKRLQYPKTKIRPITQNSSLIPPASIEITACTSSSSRLTLSGGNQQGYTAFIDQKLGNTAKSTYCHEYLGIAWN